MQGINIEIKARTTDLALLREILNQQGATFRGVDIQKDTYFKVSHGRLKLRQGQIENNLIHYFRDNQPGPKKSEVIIYPVTSDPEEIKKLLANSCGIIVEVTKTREIYYIENVKFHLDELSVLGSFVEIEVFGNDSENKELWQKCQDFMKILNISEADLVSESYSDMLLATQSSI